MGGRGASSGVSDAGKAYGSEYTTLLKSGNIKFVKKNKRESETILETMTPGRVYVAVGGNDLLKVVYFDTENKRSKTIDLSHPHNGMQPHVHHGYLHNENDGKKGAAKLTEKERRMVEKIKKIWYNHIGR